MNITSAISKNTARKIFMPYFRARRQNMQGIQDDSIFISMLPQQYQTYYTAYVSQWNQYAKGFVWGLHSKDFFSTGMGYTVCDIMVREITNGGYRFSSKDESLSNDIQMWADETGFDEVVEQAFWWANAVGNSLLKLTPIAGSKQVYAEAYPITRCMFNINKRGQVTQAKFINRFMTGGVKGKTYLAVEHRILLNGIPYYKVDLKNYSAQVQQLEIGADIVDFETLEASAKESFRSSYGNINIREWYKLPFSNLGCFNVKNKAVASALADLPGYSDSTLHTALDIIYSLDYNFTGGEMDNYFGKTTVFVPPEMRPVNVRLGASGSFSEVIEEAPLEDEVYTKLPNSSGYSEDGNKPLFIQPELRAESRKYIRDAQLELLASKVGLSSSTLANHLAYNTSKTATEVNQETDTTSVTIRNKRKLAERAINALLCEVAKYYGYADKIKIVWNKDGMSTLTYRKEIIDEYNAGLIPMEDAIRKLYPELNEYKIDEWVAKLESVQSTADIFDPNNSLLE